MTEEQFVPQLINVGVRELVSTAARLGLTWNLSIGTVTEATSSNSLLVLLDSDSEPIAVVSMVGLMSVDTRVYVITVPPSGNFAVGVVSRLYPGQRIATTTVTTDSATFTTAETSLATVTASLVTGRTYRIVWVPAFQITVDSVIRATIREDTISGTILNLRDVWIDSGGTATGLEVEVLYTAVATGDKTFVGSGDVLAGAGTANLNAASNFPSYLYVDYLEG